MDRNEIALRFAVATAQAQAMTNNGTIVKSEIMPNAFDLADAFMDHAERIDARPVKSGPCPGEDARDDAEARKRIAAPVAPKSEAAKYEPKVGDVVRFKDSAALWVVDGRVPSNRYFTVGIADAVKGSRGCCDPHELTYVRESTDAEKRIAGLPSPEATRPTHVRITKSASPSRFKDGDVLRVVGWLGDTPSVDIDCHMGGPYVLYDSKWEPADAPKAPAPVEPAKGEARAERIERCAANLSARLVDARFYTESGDAKYDSGWGVDEAHQRLIEAIEVALTPQVRA